MTARFSRTTDGDAGYTVREVGSNRAGETTSDFASFKSNLNVGVVPYTTIKNMTSVTTVAQPSHFLDQREIMGNSTPVLAASGL